MREIGIGERTHVATLHHNGFTAQSIWLGLGWLRAIEVPLNTGLTGALLKHSLRTSDAQVLVTTREFLSRVAEIESDLPDLEKIVLVDSGIDVDGSEFDKIGRAHV